MISFFFFFWVFFPSCCTFLHSLSPFTWFSLFYHPLSTTFFLFFLILSTPSTLFLHFSSLFFLSIFFFLFTFFHLLGCVQLKGWEDKRGVSFIILFSFFVIRIHSHFPFQIQWVDNFCSSFRSSNRYICISIFLLF